MRVSPQCTALFVIAQAAIILGSQDLSVNDVAKQDHSRLKREDSRFPKHVGVMKGRARIYNTRLSEETNEDSAMSFRHTDDRFRHYKPLKKFPSFSPESNTEGMEKKSKNQWGYIAQEINALAKQAEKNEKVDQNKAKAGFTEPDTTITSVTLNPTQRSPNSKHHRVKSESSSPEKIPYCPSMLENVFLCTKCLTHYIVKMNVKESKCSHCNSASSPSNQSFGDAQAAFVNIRDKLESRMRKKLYQASPQRLVHLKGRERYYNGDSQYDSAKNIFYVPVSKKAKYYKIKSKMLDGTDDSTITVPQGIAKGIKINWSEIVQEINSLSKANQKNHINVKVEPGDKAAYVVTITNPQGRRSPDGGRGIKVLSSGRGDCDCTNNPVRNTPGSEPPSCADSLENMFQCSKCKTYFLVRLNLKESKCNIACQGPKNETRLRRELSVTAELGKANNARKFCNCAPGSCDCPKYPDPSKDRGPSKPSSQETSISSDPGATKLCDPVTPGSSDQQGPSASSNCTNCPNSLETLFRCPRCKTHYEVKMHFKVSKCQESSTDKPDSALTGKAGETISLIASRMGNELRPYHRRN